MGLGWELSKAEGINLVLNSHDPGTWRQTTLELCSHQRPSGTPMGRATIRLCPPPSGHSQLWTKVKLELLTRSIPNLTIVKHHTSLTESAGAATRGNVCVYGHVGVLNIILNSYSTSVNRSVAGIT